AAALYAFGRAITGAATIDELCRAIATHVAQALGTDAAVLLPDGGRLMVSATHPAGVQLDASERATATPAWGHDPPAGRRTGRQLARRPAQHRARSGRGARAARRAARRASLA